MTHRAGGSLRPRLARRTALPVMLTLLVAQLLPGGVVADHGGREVGSILRCDRPVTPPRCTSVGDDRRHYVLFDPSLTPELASAMRSAMAGAYSQPTKLSLIEQARPTEWTDVIARSADYGDNGAAAWVYCPSGAPQGENLSGDRWCQQQELVFNLNPRYVAFFGDGASRGHVACHELGHTLGLRHWGNPPQSDGPFGATCMHANTPDGPTRLHPTDIDHINAYAYSLERGLPPSPVIESDAPDRVGAGAKVAGGLSGADEVDRPSSLEALIDSADLVVVGRITAVEAGRSFGSTHHRLHYAAVSVEVSEHLVGSVPAGEPSTLLLEVPLLDGPDQLERVRTEMLDSERVLFLRSKATSAAEAGLPLDEQLAERGFHRLVTFGSELVSVDGVTTAPPDESGVLEPFHGLAFEQALARLRTAAAR